MGFSKELGIYQPLHAEMWAVLESLLIAWDMGIKNIIVESDAQEVVRLMLEGSDEADSLLMLEIKQLLRRDWRVIVQFIPRDFNKVVDALAKLGIANSSLLEVCPPCLGAWVNQECLGLNSPYM